MMVQMVPRMWTFQIELPARTVAHLTLGMSIGIILLIKIIIVRFCKHLESSLVPMLGTGLLICTALLMGLSIPFSIREMQLSRATVGGTVYSQENVERVQRLLPDAGFPPEAPLEELASAAHLRQGRRVLLSRCVQCHDLRSILVTPRTPTNWFRTVERMGERSLLLNPIDTEDQWDVTAYLIAISPTLQASAAEKRAQENEAKEAQEEILSAVAEAEQPTHEAIAFDPDEARTVFERTCDLCHDFTRVEESPPSTSTEVRELIVRMVDNGLEAAKEDLEKIIFHLEQIYAASDR